MTSSDERREVAERLRDAKRKCEQRGYPWMTDDLILALGYEHDYMADDGIFDRLADLIDPQERTCRITRIGGDAIAAGWYACSECGLVYPPCNDDTAKWALRFCPHCGARVVGD